MVWKFNYPGAAYKMSEGSLHAEAAPCAYESSDSNAQLLNLAEDFRRIDRRLDRLVANDSEDAASSLLVLHREWAEICSRAAVLTASTREAQRAKASMLLAVLKVVVPAAGSGDPHETLAASLAKDLVHAPHG